MPKNYIKRPMTPFIILFLLLNVKFCFSFTLDNSLNRVLENGVLLIGMDPYELPYAWGMDNGFLDGSEIELARRICDKLGVKPVFRDVVWGEGHRRALREKKVDVIIDAVPIEYREGTKIPLCGEEFIFSDPYYTVNLGVVTKRDNKYIKSVNDLKGRIVGTVENTDSARYIDELLAQGKIGAKKEFTGSFDGKKLDYFIALDNNEIDAIVYDHPVLFWYVVCFSSENVKRYRILQEPLKRSEWGILLRKDDVSLTFGINSVLNQLKDEKMDYSDIMKKYLKIPEDTVSLIKSHKYLQDMLFPIEICFKNTYIPTSINTLLEKIDYPIVEIYASNLTYEPVNFNIKFTLQFGRKVQVWEKRVTISGPQNKEKIARFYADIPPTDIALIKTNTKGILTVNISVSMEDEKTLFKIEEKKPVVLLGNNIALLETEKQKIFWTLISWINPNLDIINKIVDKAAELGAEEPEVIKLVGEQDASLKDFFLRGDILLKNTSFQERIFYRRKQCELLYKASGMIYGSNIATGISWEPIQKIDFPDIILRRKPIRGTCIELALAFASILESVELRPILIILPGHAIVGWGVDTGNLREVYVEAIDTNFFGEKDFEKLISRGKDCLLQYLRLSEDVKEEGKGIVLKITEGVFYKDNVYVYDVQKYRDINKIMPIMIPDISQIK